MEDMIYENEVLAAKAAKEFMNEKVDEGYWVCGGKVDNYFSATYSSLGGSKEVYSIVFEFKPNPERDQLIWVRDYKDEDWRPRYATGTITDEGAVGAYLFGCTSITANVGDIAYWNEYSLTDPDERKVAQ